jgi:hypothetical protein
MTGLAVEDRDIVYSWCSEHYTLIQDGTVTVLSLYAVHTSILRQAAQEPLGVSHFYISGYLDVSLDLHPVP